MKANPNDMRHNFEAAAGTLTEVDPYKRAQILPSDPGLQANISSIGFSGERGSSGVDLKWNQKNSVNNRNMS